MGKKSKRVKFTFDENSLGNLENMTDYGPINYDPIPPSIGRIIAPPSWIPVGVALPEVKPTTRSDEILVVAITQTEQRFCTVGVLSDVDGRQAWLIRGCKNSVTVTHWQPLPLLPAEGK